MRVGEVSAATGVSVRAIRHYERAGLLPAARGRNGYREFDGGSVERVRTIRDLIGSGFTVAEILSLSACLQPAGPGDDCGCCTRTVALYRDKLAKIDAQVRALTQLRARIRERIGALEPC